MTKKQLRGKNLMSCRFDKFTFFPKLPIELRLAIWALALPEHNTITLTGVFGANPEILPDLEGNIIVAKASYKVPVLLHVNQESRVFAEAKYTRALRQQLGGNGVYINFKTDTLHLEGNRAIRALYGVPYLGPFGLQEHAPPRFDHSLVHREIRRLSYGFNALEEGNIVRIDATIRWYFRRFENLETMYFHDSVCRQDQQARVVRTFNRARKRRFMKIRGSSWKDAQVVFLNRSQLEKLLDSRNPLEPAESPSLDNPAVPTR